MDLQTLQMQIQELDKSVNNLSQSSTLPRNVETAFRERLNIQTGSSTTITYVSGVTQDAGTKIITVTTKTSTFTNGYLTSFT